MIKTIDSLILKQEYESGIGIVPLSKKYKTSPSVISYRLNRVGAKMRRGGRNNHILIDDQKLKEEYLSGKRTGTLAKEFNIPRMRVWSHLKKNNVEIRKDGWGRGHRFDNGYKWIRDKNNPSANSTGYIAEHRLIMEKELGRPLKRYEYVHHRNGIRNDNRVENLAVLKAEKHHGEIECPHCNKKFFIK